MTTLTQLTLLLLAAILQTDGTPLHTFAWVSEAQEEKRDQRATLALQAQSPHATAASLFFRPTQLPGGERQLAIDAHNSLFWAIDGAADDNLGVTLTSPDPALRAQLKLPPDHGVVVAALAPGGPADSVGLMPNDILLFVDDAPIPQPESLNEALKKAGEKETLSLKLMRAGKPFNISVRPIHRISIAPILHEEQKFFLGVQTSPVDATLRSHVKLPEDCGLIVNEVVVDSPAQKASLLPGDILVSLGDKPIPDTETLSLLLQSNGPKPITLALIRAGEPLSQEVVPAPRPASAEAVTLSANPHLRLDPHSDEGRKYLYFTHPQANLGDGALLTQTPSPHTYLGLLNTLKGARFQPTEVASDEKSAASLDMKKLDQRLDQLNDQLEQLRKSIDALKSSK